MSYVHRLGVPVPVKTLFVLVLGLVVLAATAQAAETASPDASSSWPHTAQCAAVMKREAVAMADRYKAGDAAQKPGMVLLAEDSFALLGTAYKQGLRKAEADRLLAAAEREVSAIPPPAQRQLLGDCRTEGRDLFKGANFVERAIVSNRARARVEQLIKP